MNPLGASHGTWRMIWGQNINEVSANETIPSSPILQLCDVRQTVWLTSAPRGVSSSCSLSRSVGDGRTEAVVGWTKHDRRSVVGFFRRSFCFYSSRMPLSADGCGDALHQSIVVSKHRTTFSEQSVLPLSCRQLFRDLFRILHSLSATTKQRKNKKGR